MSKVIANTRISHDFYCLKVAEKNQAAMGQFYMLRSWDEYPVLSRPISVFDADESSVSFLYKVVGKGTELFTKLEPGDNIALDGPHGNGYPQKVGKKIAMVGGGVGIAPLYLTAKTYKELDPEIQIHIFLGFSDQELLVDKFEQVADRVITNVGGFITDEIDPAIYDTILTCGPGIMMKVLYEKCLASKTKAEVYVSMENRMACGIGACKVCTCKTKSGNRTVCKDGPVFLGSEVF